MLSAAERQEAVDVQRAQRTPRRSVTYLLDSDVFMQAKQRYYPFDVCPAFWDWLDREAAAGTVRSIQAVLTEIRAGADELTDWANDRADFFPPPDQPVVTSLSATAEWAQGADYEPAAVNVFLEGADYYLVAHAHAHQYTVVTHEVADNSKKIKIPEACIGMDVPFMNPFAMLAAERARFVLAPAD